MLLLQDETYVFDVIDFVHCNCPFIESFIIYHINKHNDVVDDASYEFPNGNRCLGLVSLAIQITDDDCHHDDELFHLHRINFLIFFLSFSLLSFLLFLFYN